MLTSGATGGTVLDTLIVRLMALNDSEGFKTFERRLDRTRRKMDRLGNLMLGVGLAGAGAMAGIGTTIYKLEVNLNALRAATNATTEDMGRMRAQALQLGRTTAFTAAQAAEAQKLLGQAGLQTGQILEAMPYVLNLAAAGNLEMGEAAAIATSTVAGFRLEVGDLGRVADGLATAASSAKTTVSDMGFALTKTAASAAEVGLPLEKAMAILAGLQNFGIDPSIAGTGLRNILRLSVKQSEEAKKSMRSIGVDPEDIKGLGNEGKVVEIMRMLKTAGAGLEEFGTIFEARTAESAMVIGSGWEQIEGIYQKILKDQGSATRMAEQQLAGIVGAWKIMLSQIDDFKIALGDAGVTQAIIDMTSAVGKALDWFAALSPETKAMVSTTIIWVTKLIAVGLALKGIALVLGAVIGGFRALRAVIVMLTALKAAIIAVTAAVALAKAGFVAFGIVGAIALAPIWLIVAAVAAVVAAVVALVYYWDEVKAAISSALEMAARFVAMIAGGIGGALEWLGDAVGLGPSASPTPIPVPVGPIGPANHPRGPTTNTRNVNAVVEKPVINIDARGTSPEAIGQVVGNEMVEQFKRGAQNADDEPWR